MAKKKASKKVKVKPTEVEVEIEETVEDEIDIFAEELNPEIQEPVISESQEAESLAPEVVGDVVSDKTVKFPNGSIVDFANIAKADQLRGIEDPQEDFGTADLEDPKEKRLVGRHPITKKPVYRY